MFGFFDNFPDKDKIIKLIKDITLSARTVHDRTIMMSKQIEDMPVKDINADVSNFSQFSVTARFVVIDSQHEESLAVLTMKGPIRGEDCGEQLGVSGLSGGQLYCCPSFK